MTDRPGTFELVLSQLRKHSFAVLSTIGEEGTPHSTGVNLGISSRGGSPVIYVMTRKHLRKARSIAQNPNVSLVVPLTRRLLWFLPPPTVQLSGHAEIADWADEEGTEVFRDFWMGRRTLVAYQESRRRGETRVCSLKITRDPLIHTYLVGSSIWQLRKRMESGAATIAVPPGYRSSASSSRTGTAGPQ